MFSALIEATTPEGNGRKAGDRYAIIAVVDGDENTRVVRATSELKVRGWSTIEIKRVGPVAAAEVGAAPTYISAAVADAKDSGFGLVVYDQPIRAS